MIAATLSDDPRQAAEAARLHAFDGLLYDAFTSRLNLPELSVSGLREFRQMLRSQDRQLVGLRTDLGTKGMGIGADVDRLLARSQQVLQCAAALLSPLVCLDVGALPPATADVSARRAITPEQAGKIILPSMLMAAPAPRESGVSGVPGKIDSVFAAQVDAALIELGRIADRYSVTVALRSDLASFASIERALKAANCPWFGIDLDPVAILRDDWSLDEVFSRLGPLVRHVRARDAQRGDQGRTRPAIIGRGDVPWPQLLSALDETGYHGWLSVDSGELADRVAAADMGREFLISAG